MGFLRKHLQGKRLFNSGKWAVFTVIVYECIENLLEYAIAYLVSSAITVLLIKTLATFAIITVTQVMSNQTQRFFLTFIKKFTYKKGDDKVEKLKSIWQIIKSNKCSLVVILCSLLLCLTGTKVINADELPVIEIGSEKHIEAVIQKEDLIATEDIYSEPVLATEDIYSEPVLADKLTIVATQTIYEDDGSTIKYNVGDIIANSDFFKYSSQVKIYNEGDIIEPAKLLFSVGDVVEEAKLLYAVGDVITPAGTILEEEKVIPPVNITPYLYNILLTLGVGIAGCFFESPNAYEKRKKEASLIKEAKKELANEKSIALIEQKQKVAEAEKAKCDEEKRLKLEEIKAEIKAGNV